jgi:hypothetical protein
MWTVRPVVGDYAPGQAPKLPRLPDLAARQAVRAAPGPREPSPESSLPDSSLPESSLPDSSLPESSFPESSLPEFSLPEFSLPEFSEQSDNEMEDDNTAEAESENGEEEDHDMDDEHSADGGPAKSEPAALPSADGEESDDEPLTADSQWPRRPSRRKVLRLAMCSDLEDGIAQERFPPSTAKNVILNALASSRFLIEVGESVVHPKDMGIDSNGRLFKIDSDCPRPDYREAFCEMLTILHKNWIYEDIRKQMQVYIDASDPGFFGDFTEKETKDLRSLVEAVLREPYIGIPKLRAVSTECEKVVANLDKTISLVNAVKQDLLDTGSTSLKRWNQLQSIGWPFSWRLKQLADGSADPTTRDNIKEIVRDMTQEAWSYQAPLGLALKLMRDLEIEIDQISVTIGH